MPLWNPRADETLRYTPRHITPAELAQVFLDPESRRIVQGITSITVDFATRSLVVTGPADTLYQTERILHLVDQKPREVRLDFWLEKEGKELYRGEIPKAKNNKPAEWRKGELALTFRPHVNGDGSVSLMVETNSQRRFARINSDKPFSFSFEEGTLVVVPSSPHLLLLERR